MMPGRERAQNPAATKVFSGLGIAIVGNFAPRGSGIYYQGEVLYDSFTADGARCFSISHVWNRWWRPVATVFWLIWHARRYDVLCCQGFSNRNWINGALAITVGKALGKRVTMVYRGGGFREFVKRSPWAVLPFLRRVDGLVVPSGFLHAEFVKHGLRHRVIPNVIELEGFPYRRRERLAPRILWVRHLRRGYNPWMAIEVLERVRRRFPDATLRMAGDGYMEEEMRARIAAENVTGVQLLGHLPLAELKRHYDESDVFINTTNVDNQPRSVMEAMASGLPVVSTNVGGVPFLITERENGLLVPPRNPDAMAAAVLELIDDPALGLRLADNAITMVRSFSWKVSRRKWAALFAELGLLSADRLARDDAEAAVAD
jgi:glycosyltransferase involved in cell wall biosynthesis